MCGGVGVGEGVGRDVGGHSQARRPFPRLPGSASPSSLASPYEEAYSASSPLLLGRPQTLQGQLNGRSSPTACLPPQ